MSLVPQLGARICEAHILTVSRQTVFIFCLHVSKLQVFDLRLVRSWIGKKGHAVTQTQGRQTWTVGHLYARLVRIHDIDKHQRHRAVVYCNDNVSFVFICWKYFDKPPDRVNYIIGSNNLIIILLPTFCL